MTRQLATLLAATACLALAACASKPKPAPATATPPARTQAPPMADPAPAPAPQASGVTPGSQEDLAQSAGERVFFATDSFDIDASASDTLRAQAAWLARNSSVRVRIEGNADERGTREYNLGLGARRAEAIRRVLVQQGVAGARIQTMSYGKERPLDGGTGEDAWARNRNGRTVIIGY